MNKFTINGNVYTAPHFDFNTMCDLEEAGVPLSQGKERPTSMVRAYFALLFDGDKEAAGRELEEHMIKGGDFEELTTAMINEMNESRFFQAITEKTEESGQSGTETKKKK